MTAALVARYGGLRSEQLQARMLAGGEDPGSSAVEQFSGRARELFHGIRSTPGRAIPGPG